MSSLFFVILLVGFSGIMVSGLLFNNFIINSQEIGIFDDPSELTTTECTCEDPNSPGNFGSEFCDPIIFEQGSFCSTLLNQVQSLTMEDEPQFVEPQFVEPQNFVGKGCDATYWRELQNPEITQTNAWPPEYIPDFHFNDIFLTTLDNSYFLVFYVDSNNSINQLARGDLIDRLQALKTQYQDDILTTEKIDLAISSIQNSLNIALWINDSHLNPNGGEQIFEEDKNAILNLTFIIQTQEIIIQNTPEENKLIEEEKLQTLREIIMDIIDSERGLVGNAIEDAQAYVKDTDELELAVLEFNNGEEKFQLEEYNEALNFNKNSWIHSQNALGLYNTENSYGPTLLEALSEKPTHHFNSIGLHDLSRESMAALLNAGHEYVPYYYSSQEVLDMAQIAILDGNVGTFDEFEGLNNLHVSVICP
jgi:hypothetical protein